MTSAYTARELLGTARDGLLAIGYRNELVRSDYTFADPLTPLSPLRGIDLAALPKLGKLCPNWLLVVILGFGF